MKRRYRIVFVILGFMALAAIPFFTFYPASAAAQSSNQGAQPDHRDMWNPYWAQRHMWGPGPMGSGMRHRMMRHRTFMQQGVPEAYHGARNPLNPDSSVIGEGGVLYQENCASCHGMTGMGDGEAARSLNPSPALLAYMIQMPMSVDEYMYWSISDGGAAFGTAMPAFKDILSEDEIWKIVTYMRAGFPAGSRK